MRNLLIVMVLTFIFLGCSPVAAQEGGWKANLKAKFCKVVGIPEKSNGATDIMYDVDPGSKKGMIKIVLTTLSPATLFFRVVFHEVRRDLQENYWNK